MFPLVSGRHVGLLTWRFHTKHYNFQWYPSPNNSSSEYRTSPKLWHVVYLLLFYDISISWLNLLDHGKRFYFSVAWSLRDKLTCVTWKPPITSRSSQLSWKRFLGTSVILGYEFRFVTKFFRIIGKKGSKLIGFQEEKWQICMPLIKSRDAVFLPLPPPPALRR